MVRGGKRENAGRKPLEENETTIRLSVKVPLNTECDIEHYGIGNNKSDKIRYVIDRGLETIRKEQE